jgi:hypothetical protein
VGDDDDAARRLEQTLELWEDGVAMMRERLARKMPGATAAELEAALDAWLIGPSPVATDLAPGTWPRKR